MFDTIAVTKTQKRVVHPGKRAAINMCSVADDTAQVLTCAYLLTPAFSARVLRPPTGAPAQGAPFRPPLEARPPPLPRDLLPIFTGPKLVQLASVFTRDADRYFQVMPQQPTLLEPRVQNPKIRDLASLLLEASNWSRTTAGNKLTRLLSRERDKAFEPTRERRTDSGLESRYLPGVRFVLRMRIQ